MKMVRGYWNAHTDQFNETHTAHTLKAIAETRKCTFKIHCKSGIRWRATEEKNSTEKGSQRIEAAQCPCVHGMIRFFSLSLLFSVCFSVLFAFFPPNVINFLLITPYKRFKRWAYKIKQANTCFPSAFAAVSFSVAKDVDARHSHNQCFTQINVARLGDRLSSEL